MYERVCFYSRPFPRINSYHDMIDLAAEYGMTAVEGFVQWELAEPDLEKARELRAYADSKNIKFCCLSAFLSLVGEDSAEQVERLKRYADVAVILGSPYLHHTAINEIYDPSNVLTKKEELFEKGISAVREVYDYAESVGIRTIIEDQGYIYNGVEGFGRFLEAIDRNIGVVADFGNIYQVEEHITDFIKLTKDRICHAHIKDVRLAPEQQGGGLPTSKGNFMHEAFLGEGDSKFEEGMRMLREMGYEGYYSLEFSARSDDSPLVDKALKMIDERI